MEQYCFNSGRILGDGSRRKSILEPGEESPVKSADGREVWGCGEEGRESLCVTPFRYKAGQFDVKCNESSTARKTVRLNLPMWPAVVAGEWGGWCVGSI